MKRLIVTIVALCALTAASAQMRTSYFMEGSYFRTDLNPALAPTRSYIALPVMSGMGMGMNNNFLSVDNFIYSREGQTVTALDSRVESSEFLNKLPQLGHLSLNSNINILGVGFYTKKMFWNFGINARIGVDFTAGKELFSALKNLGNHTYDLTTVGVDGSAYTEVYLGFNRRVTKWMAIGARVKGIVGIANVNGSVTSGNFNITKSEVVGNVYGQLRGSCMMINSNYTRGEIEDTSELFLEEFNPKDIGKSWGLAVDFGAEVRLLSDHLRLSVGVTDLGFTKWSSSGAAAAEFNYGFKYRGMNIDTGEWDAEADGGLTMTEPMGYTRRLNATLNIGAEYNILNNHIAFGLLSHTEFRQLYTLSELTASVNFRLGKVFTTTLSHTFCGRNRPGIFGFALNLHTAGPNLFFGADYIDTSYVAAGQAIAPKFQKSFNFYMGMGLNISKYKRY
ncbi:MAG: hypothetical protein IJX65_03345 [Alistipes sp.]|nr:hypothetical protein [Alistipes sp.]